MRRGLAFAAIITAVLVGYLVMQRLSPAHQVRALVSRQEDMWKSGDIQGLYATFSPQLQAQCPYAAVAALASKATQGLSQFGFPTLSFKITSLSVSGDTATMTGTLSAGPQVIYTTPPTDPARFVRTPDGWLLDSVGSAADTGCATAAAP